MTINIGTVNLEILIYIYSRFSRDEYDRNGSAIQIVIKKKNVINQTLYMEYACDTSANCQKVAIYFSRLRDHKIVKL